MTTSNSLPELVPQLIRRGLPADYAQRAAAEIADHHRDLIDELHAAGMSESQATTEASHRLGDPHTLVKKTVREYQRRHWCARWPLLTFLFGPLVLLVAAWACTIVVFMVLGYALEAAGFNPASDDGVISTGERIGMWCVVGWFIFALPAAVLLFLSRRAARAALGWQWVALAAIVLAVNVGTMQCGYTGELAGRVSASDSTTGQPLPPDRFMVCSPMWMFFPSVNQAVSWFVERPLQLCQLLVPLTVAVLAIWWNLTQLRRREQGFGAVC